MQTWISLLAENDGSQVMDTECSKEKFFTTYKRLSCLHTFSTVKLWTWREHNEANVKGDVTRRKSSAYILAVGPPGYLVGTHII